ncbi:MAG: hypothetical protein JWM95_1629 [Gemmatimonadetes bacterium]|nr:hypothetical protein [Gemmatimonadota bacterium]
MSCEYASSARNRRGEEQHKKSDDTDAELSDRGDQAQQRGVQQDMSKVGVQEAGCHQTPVLAMKVTTVLHGEHRHNRAK